MNATEGKQFQPVEGREFPESVLSIIGMVLLGTFVIAPLGVVLVLAWWHEWSFANRQISWYGALIGMLLVGLGLLSPLLLVRIFRREVMIVGKEAFQVVVAGKVTQQIPYRNIAGIRLFRDHESADFVRDFIGIDLANLDDMATLYPAAETIKQLHGWHCRIEKGFRSVPLEQLYELIMKQMPPRTDN
jgi:hypothetical protein